MGEVGRFSEAARLFGSLKGSAPTATQYHWHIQSLWASGQTDEAERLLRDAVEIYGSNTSIWWQRFDMLLHGGQAAAAIAFSEDRNARPGDIDRVELEDAVDAAKVSLAGGRADVNRVVATLRSHARVSAWLAERAVTNACLLGQIDAAFEFADALLFSRGFVVPDFAATAGRAPRTSLGERSPQSPVPASNQGASKRPPLRAAHRAPGTDRLLANDAHGAGLSPDLTHGRERIGRPTYIRARCQWPLPTQTTPSGGATCKAVSSGLARLAGDPRWKT